MTRKAPPKGLVYCAAAGCDYFALNDQAHCVGHSTLRDIRVTGGPWPERVGCTGWDVTGEMNPKVYPRAGLGKDEIIICLRHDPLEATVRSKAHRPPWTCVIDRSDVQP